MADRIDTAAERRRLIDNEAVLHRIPRYLDALDAERARAEKAEAERDEWKDEYQAAERLLYRYKNAATNRQAERDQALARLAAPLNCDDGVLYQAMNDGYGRYEDFKRDVLAAFRPAPDAEAALQRVVDAAWNDAVEAAAKIVNGTAKYHMSDPDDIEAVHLTATEIRALKRPEASHE